jgi:hypothetical protein
LKVERVDRLRVLDGPDRGQESFFAPDSRTVNQPPEAPPFFITHEKTHIVRYLNTPDDGNSLDSELIDEIRFTDPNDRGQDTYIILANPPNNQGIDGITIGDPVEGTNDGNGNPIYTIQVDPNLDDISDSENGIDPPWRLDPFQNIVSGGYYVLFLFRWYDRNYGPDLGDVRVGIPLTFVQGTQGYCHTNNTIVDMIGDTGNPLTSEKLVNDDPGLPMKDLLTTLNGGGKYRSRSNWYENENDNWVSGGGDPHNISSPFQTPAENPNPPPAFNFSGDVSPQNVQAISYLYSAEPSAISIDNPDPPDKFLVEYTGMTELVPSREHGPAIAWAQFTYTPTHVGGFTDAPALEIHVYARADVRLHLEDKFFPLRLKDDHTVYETDGTTPASDKANSATRWKAKSITYSYANTAYAKYPTTPVNNDEYDLDYTNVAKNGVAYSFKFAKYKFADAPGWSQGGIDPPSAPFDPHESFPIVWPVTPATAIQQDGEGNPYKVGGYVFSVRDPSRDGQPGGQESLNAGQNYIFEADKYIDTGAPPTTGPTPLP